MCAEVRVWDPEAGDWQPEPVWRKVMTARAGNRELIAHAVVAPTLYRDGNPPALAVEFGAHTVEVRPLEGGPYLAVGPTNEAIWDMEDEQLLEAIKHHITALSERQPNVA